MSSKPDPERIQLLKSSLVTDDQATLGRSEVDLQRASRRTASKTESDIEVQDHNAVIEHDRVWQVLLAQLLGRLEYGRTHLRHSSFQKNPIGAVRVAIGMVNEVAHFITQQIDPQAFRKPLSDALAVAHRFLTAAKVAATEEPGRGFFGLFKSPVSDAKKQECMWILGDLPLLLERYFTMLGSCFKSSRVAIEWVDVSGLFLTDLKNALAWVEKGDPKTLQVGQVRIGNGY